ncbi:zinc ABC transporter substrate-binding protein, partial [Gardnerella vaginalis]
MHAVYGRGAKMCENTFHLSRAKKICKAILACAIVPSMLIGMAGCGANSQSSEKTTHTKKEIKQIKVVSTLESWASLAREIGGNDVVVKSIINKPDVDSSSF